MPCSPVAARGFDMTQTVYSIVKSLIEHNGFVTNAMIETYGVDITYTARNRIREYETKELKPLGMVLIYEKGARWCENKWTVASTCRGPVLVPVKFEEDADGQFRIAI